MGVPAAAVPCGHARCRLTEQNPGPARCAPEPDTATGIAGARDHPGTPGLLRDKERRRPCRIIISCRGPDNDTDRLYPRFQLPEPTLSSITAPRMPARADGERTVYTVARLNFETKALLENGFPLLWVEGEISNLATPRSGHVYFTLKDERAQIRCAMFRSRHRLLKQPLNAGDQVLVRARLTLYEPRGDMQLTVEHVEPAGEGALLLAYEALRQKLAEDGLFDIAAKRPLPTQPRHIAVVTSPTGAAVQDILTTLRQRWPIAQITLVPVPVQGTQAAPAIVHALERLVPRLEPDLVILARGGGSLEDLWPFNEEPVVRAVHRCAVPIVCGVGHETDTTLADLAADIRGATPTAAVIAAVPDQAELKRHLLQQTRRLLHLMHSRLRTLQQGADWLGRRLRQPHRLLALAAERLSGMQRRLVRETSGNLKRRRQLLSLQVRLLPPLSPWQRIVSRRAQLAEHHRRLFRATTTAMRHKQASFGTGTQRLHLLSPLGVLQRGYAALRDEQQGLVCSVNDVSQGQRLEALVGDGTLECRVEHRRPGIPGWLYRTAQRNKS